MKIFSGRAILPPQYDVFVITQLPMVKHLTQYSYSDSIIVLNKQKKHKRKTRKIPCLGNRKIDRLSLIFNKELINFGKHPTTKK